jgi:hypothetical protein
MYLKASDWIAQERSSGNYENKLKIIQSITVEDATRADPDKIKAPR